MIKVRMNVDTARLDAMIARSPQVADNCSYDAADFILDYIKAHWSAYSPSKPYRPPAKLTGELEESLRVRRRGGLGRWIGRGGNVTAYEITAGAEYAAALEFGKVNAPNTIIRRPFMRPAGVAAGQRVPPSFFPIIDPRTLVYNKTQGRFVPAYSHLDPVLIDFDEMWGAAQAGWSAAGMGDVDM